MLGDTMKGAMRGMMMTHELLSDEQEMEHITRAFREKGWGRLRPGEYAGIRFDLIGRKYIPNNWRLLIRKVPVVDKAAIKDLKRMFGALRGRCDGMFMQGFLLYVIADSIAPDVRLPAGGLDSLENRGLLILDKKNRRVYGDIVYGDGDVFDALYRQMNAAENIMREAYNPERREDVLPPKEFVPQYPPWRRNSTFILGMGLVFPPLALGLMWTGDVYDDTDEQNPNVRWSVQKKVVVTVVIGLVHLYVYHLGMYDWVPHALFGGA